MENNPLHVVRLSGSGAKNSGVSPLRLTAASSRNASAQVLLKRNVVQGSGAVRLSYNQTKISERAGLQFVEERIVTERKVVTHQKVEAQPIPSNFGFSFGQGFFSKAAVFMLIPMLLVYPIIPAYAADDATAPAVDSTPPPASDTTPAPDSTPTDASTSDTGTPPSTDTASGADASDTALPTTETTEIPAATDTAQQSAGDTAAGSTETGSGTSGETSVITAQAATTTDDTGGEIIAGSGSIESTASSTMTETNASTTDETASTTPESTESVTDVSSSTDETVAPEETPVEAEAVTPETPEQYASRLLSEREGVLRNEIRKQIESEFTRGCVTMDTVGYYCLKDGAANTTGTSAEDTGVVTAVNAVQGSTNSYKQISMTKGGVTTEITNDNWDNAFPTTDVSGKSLVWQGSVDGRWQIFFADASGTGTPKIAQVTHSTESNFNPRVDGKDIVWQGWVDGNWEVYLAEHLDVGAELALDAPLPEENARLGIDRTWSVTRITTNNEHDMFPSLSGGLITWQSFQGGTWNVFAYSLKTKSVVKLSRDGAKSEHPRFAITWDERGDDGQTRMMGYDIATGKVIDITGEARQTPNDTKPYQPEAPISKDNQAALPISTSTSTSTSSRSDDGDGGVGNGLDI